jgi:hypothetical protein
MFLIGYQKQKKAVPLREKPKKGKYENVFNGVSETKKKKLQK